MRYLAAVVCAMFVASLVLGVATPVFAAAKTHQVKATVVSVDLENSKITFKDEKGEDKTAPVMDKGVEDLKTVKAGDKVTLTCTDSETGEHQGVTAIKKG
jgi:Cu/Ag efflux protein CusF